MFSERLQAIDAERRREAAEQALKRLPEFSEGHRYVLSYASLPSEFNTWPINAVLAKQGRLLLPRIDGDLLTIFQVNQMDTELERNAWGLFQPATCLKEEIDHSLITLVLVPGLGFDRRNHRLGYGKGYYDRFLKSLGAEVISLGIGFKEQWLQDEDFPMAEHDIQLTSLLTF